MTRIIFLEERFGRLKEVFYAALIITLLLDEQYKLIIRSCQPIYAGPAFPDAVRSL